MKHLLLIRHGKTEANEKFLYCGHTDIGLTDNGKSELEKLRLTKTYPDIKKYHIYTSGMRRTEETLRILYGDVPHKALPEFKEMNFGDFEMKSYKDLMLDGLYKKWALGDNKYIKTPGGESNAEVEKRIKKGMKKLLFIPGDILVVCHGGPISGIMHTFFPNEGKNMYEWQPNGGEGYLITFKRFKPVSYKNIPE